MFTTTNSAADVYAEHLDSVREKDDITQIASFLDNLSVGTILTQTIIMYISANTISSSVWSPVSTKLIDREFVHLVCIDECHYISSAGQYFRPEFHINIYKIIGLLWNKCPMLLCSATVTNTSMYHTSMVLHPDSTVATLL